MSAMMLCFEIPPRRFLPPALGEVATPRGLAPGCDVAAFGRDLLQPATGAAARVAYGEQLRLASRAARSSSSVART